ARGDAAASLDAPAVPRLSTPRGGCASDVPRSARRDAWRSGPVAARSIPREGNPTLRAASHVRGEPGRVWAGDDRAALDRGTVRACFLYYLESPAGPSGCCC